MQKSVEFEKFKLFPLVEKRSYCEECINLLNEEWPRNLSQRRRIIEKCLNLIPPLSVILLNVENDELIGHARICTLPNDGNACWVESVIVKKSLRGVGIGALLMQMVEDKALELGFKKVCLSTDDKEIFYMKCGYSISPPILNVGAHFNSNLLTKYQALVGKMNVTAPVSTSNNTNSFDDICQSPATLVESRVSPPPPPPPPPVFSKNKSDNCEYDSLGEKSILPEKITYMSKYLP